MTTLLIARHGETDWNRDGRFQGHADPPLNERGRGQARELAERLVDVPLDAVYASDLPRARETAEIVAAARGMQVVVEPRLREIDVGSWQGRTRAELVDADWDGETYEQHRERVLAAVLGIAKRHPGGHVLLVTHGGCLRRLQEVVIGEALPVLENCSLWGVACRDGVLVALD